jgi:hypothetical protein
MAARGIIEKSTEQKISENLLNKMLFFSKTPKKKFIEDSKQSLQRSADTTAYGGEKNKKRLQNSAIMGGQTSHQSADSPQEPDEVSRRRREEGGGRDV